MDPNIHAGSSTQIEGVTWFKNPKFEGGSQKNDMTSMLSKTIEGYKEDRAKMNEGLNEDLYNLLSEDAQDLGWKEVPRQNLNKLPPELLNRFMLKHVGKNEYDKFIKHLGNKTPAGLIQKKDFNEGKISAKKIKNEETKSPDKKTSESSNKILNKDANKTYRENLDDSIDKINEDLNPLRGKMAHKKNVGKAFEKILYKEFNTGQLSRDEQNLFKRFPKEQKIFYLINIVSPDNRKIFYDRYMGGKSTEYQTFEKIPENEVREKCEENGIPPPDLKPPSLASKAVRAIVHENKISKLFKKAGSVIVPKFADKASRLKRVRWGAGLAAAALTLKLLGGAVLLAGLGLTPAGPILLGVALFGLAVLAINAKGSDASLKEIIKETGKGAIAGAFIGAAPIGIGMAAKAAAPILPMISQAFTSEAAKIAYAVAGGLVAGGILVTFLHKLFNS